MVVMDTSMCIYHITHIETGEKYVGQTTNKLSTRWLSHCRPNSYCVRLSRAIQKHGKDAFEIAVLEVCETIDQLNEREIYWIKELNTLSPNGYNLNSGGKNGFHSEETKLKMSLSHKNISDETRKKLSVAVIGKRHSEESKAKMRVVVSNRPPISEETRRVTFK